MVNFIKVINNLMRALFSSPLSEFAEFAENG